MSEGVLLVVEQLRRPVPGGIGTYAGALAGALARLGPAATGPVTLFASRVHGDEPLEAYGLPIETAPVGGRLLVRAWDAGLLAPRGEHALVHATSFAIPPRSKAPLVVTVHDLAFRHVPEAYPPRGRRWHEAALERAKARAAHFVTPSETVAEELRAELAATRAAEVSVIEEGADHLPPGDAVATDALLARLRVASGFLLAVGTLEPRKNLVRLLRAYEAARGELPEPWPLLVVGPAGWGEEVVAPEGAVLTGAVGPAVLAELYRRCRCLAYVPLLEGYGLPVVEAMHAGAPVVASDVPSAAGAALRVDPLDPDAIAAGLVAASIEGERRERLVAAGLARVSGLGWRQTASAHLECWRQVASR